MRIKLFVLALLVSLTALLVPSPPKAQAVVTDCDTVAVVCGDIAEMLYDMCIVNGGGLSQCAWMEANYKISCMRNNGCAPINN